MSAPTLVFHGVTIFACCLFLALSEALFCYITIKFLLICGNGLFSYPKNGHSSFKKWSFLFQKVVIPLC